MSALLAEAIAQLGLAPGDTYRTKVNGHEIEVRILDASPRSEPPAERSQFEDAVMVDLWLDVPPSPDACIVVPQRGEPILPSPFEITDSDLAPE